MAGGLSGITTWHLPVLWVGRPSAGPLAASPTCSLSSDSIYLDVNTQLEARCGRGPHGAAQGELDKV